MTRDLIPPRFADAESDLPQVEQWCASVLQGESARMLLLGPIFSGKTHTAFAALRRLLSFGYPRHRIAVYSASVGGLGENYETEMIDAGPRVIFLDNLTDPVDNHVGVKVELEVDEPLTQAALALSRAVAVDAADRLASRANTSWICCGSGRDALRTCLGKDVAEKLLAVADVVELPERPRPDVRW
ncbi:hypothetical protein AB0O34_36660 [Sphaerisporangium sp. NPDC088356]|uniref:hypothetical protein n=1 Tax=Sphaerisporangium sp. NPDC088356 TaxID=3154871 RepID=UPI00344112C0